MTVPLLQMRFVSISDPVILKPLQIHLLCLLRCIASHYCTSLRMEFDVSATFFNAILNFYEISASDARSASCST